MFNRITYIALVLGIILAAANDGLAVQYGRPTATAASGNWGPIGTTSLHEATDETTANGDTDYAVTTTDDDIIESKYSD